MTGLVLPKAAQGDAVLRLMWTGGPQGEPPSGLSLLSEIPGWIDDVRARGARSVSLLGVVPPPPGCSMA